MFPKNIAHRNTYIFGVVFTFCFLISAAIINYFTWSPGPTEPGFGAFILWTFLYLPIFIFCKYADWKIKDFGYVLNYGVFALTALVVVIIMFNIHNFHINNLRNALVETYARTGEEVFFRGFLYELILRLFKNKKRPWIWAVLISSICFAGVHTQTFLPACHTTMISVFEAAVFLALLRYWTGSILPGIVINIAVNLGGASGVTLGILFYYLFTLLTHKRGERVFEKGI